MLDPLPGAEPFPGHLARRLADAVAARGTAHAPRTHHLRDGRPRFTNRLAVERSPYLLQHAHNPVSWWPWGEEAFAEARRTGLPVFLLTTRHLRKEHHLLKPMRLQFRF